MLLTAPALASQGVANAFALNALLRDLPGNEMARIDADLEAVDTPLKTVIYEPNRRMDHVFFPLSGVLSLLALGGPAGAIEVGTIGNEGMFGLAVFNGMDDSPQQCFAQIGARSLRLSAARFRDAIPHMPLLRERIHRYAQAFFNDVAQSVACNQLHSLEQRCARWLLMTHDRVRGDEFVLTQQFLALMVGTRRESVSAAANALRKRGCIEYSRGRIEIVDRAKLEEASCSCYRVTRAAYTRIAPVS